MASCRAFLHWVLSFLLFWVLCLSGVHKWTWTVGSLELSEELYKDFDIKYRHEIAPEWGRRTGYQLDPVKFKTTFGGGELCGGFLLLTPWWRLGVFITAMLFAAAIVTQVWLREEGKTFPAILLACTLLLPLIADQKKRTLLKAMTKRPPAPAKKSS